MKIDIQAIILDMDGLLIDSQPFWEKAILKQFDEIGIPLTLEKVKSIAGMRIDEVIAMWFEELAIENHSKKEIEEGIIEILKELVRNEGQPCLGVRHLFEEISKLGLPVAIASSSRMDIVDVVMNKLEIRNHIKIVHSATDEDYGKPHPAVFMTTAKRLGVKVEGCLVFEDSLSGVISAKAAKMKCIAVPSKEAYNLEKFVVADKVLNSLDEFNKSLLDSL